MTTIEIDTERLNKNFVQCPSLMPTLQAVQNDAAAARAAAGAALSQTKTDLQQSALHLVERMIAASDEATQ